MTYWHDRQDLFYYRVVRKWLESFGACGTLMDVGCADTPVAQYGDFLERIAVNDRPFPPLDGVECIQADWMDCNLNAHIITCLQVLEHFETDYLRAFVDKIFRSSCVSIISVPYLWPADCCEHHRQDPINIGKFLQLMGREPIKLEIVQDSSRKRLVALFENGSPE